MLENKKNGFTMIEMMFVVAIVGLLAGISLPLIWKNIARQQGQEALNTMNMMRSAMETCGIANGYDFSSCGGAGWPNLNMADPSGTTFTYSWDLTGGAGTYCMTATNGANWIKECRAATGVMTCTTNGIYKGMC